MSYKMSETQRIFQEWWRLLKKHHEELQSADRGKWEDVVKGSEEWRFKNASFPFAPRLEMLELDILQWIHEKEGQQAAKPQADKG